MAVLWLGLWRDVPSCRGNLKRNEEDDSLKMQQRG